MNAIGKVDRAARAAFYNLGAIVIADEATAIIDLGSEDAPRSLSRAELDALCNAVARGLVKRGLARGDRVAVLAANSAEYLASVLGIMRAGLVAVPVNFKLPPALITFILDDSNCRLIICDAKRGSHCPPDIARAIIHDAGGTGFDALLDHGAFEPVRPAPDEAALFLYTSGSTGRPKGVVLTHGGHLWGLRARPRWSSPDQRVLVAAPLYHMNGLMTSMASLSQSGSTIVMLPAFTSGAYIRAIERYRCNVVTAVPTMISLMLRDRENLEKADLSSVRFMRIGSAASTQALMDSVLAMLPATEITNAFGTTEGGPVVFAGHLDGIKRPELSVGYPHAEVETRLVDGEGRDGEEGELHLRCPAVMKGYHNLPNETARALTADGFYKTGDQFRKDGEGFYYFVGRKDDMFNCGGENIYPGEIEKVLERHPDIQQASVVPVPDEIKGHKPVAFVVAAPASSLTEEAVKSYALASMAAYQHPRRVWFLANLPLSGTNKVDRAALTRHAAELISNQAESAERAAERKMR
jgi:long-chain acyl-CoA synthetase